tara:strand:+ start:171 stop:374 length:204 start_codon:yes stop_codon:yes gene_type:complete
MTNTETTNLEGLKKRYAEMIVDGLDMNDLITIAVESIVENLKGYELDDIKDEILDVYDAQTWFYLNP